MKKRRVLSVVLAASMFAMLLTGCGGGNQGSAEGSQAAAIGQGVAEAESCIKIGVSGTPDLDPAIVNTGSSLIAAINIYDTRSTGAESYRMLAAEVISRGEE